MQRVERTRQYVCHCVRARACVWFPRTIWSCLNSLHICAGNNSSSPHRNDHSLSGLIRHILDLNDVGASDPNLISLLCDGTQSPMACAFNSILCLGKTCRSTDHIHEVCPACTPLGDVTLMGSDLFTFGLIKCENMTIINFMFSLFG